MCLESILARLDLGGVTVYSLTFICVSTPWFMWWFYPRFLTTLLKATVWSVSVKCKNRWPQNQHLWDGNLNSFSHLINHSFLIKNQSQYAAQEKTDSVSNCTRVYVTFKQVHICTVNYTWFSIVKYWQFIKIHKYRQIVKMLSMISWKSHGRPMAIWPSDINAQTVRRTGKD